METILAERCAYTHGGSWDMPNTDSESGKPKWQAKGNPAEMFHRSDSDYHKGMTLLVYLCVYPHILYTFSPSKYFICFISFCLCGNSFLKSWRARALSLTTGLVARIQHSHCCDLISVSGQEPKPCFKVLQAKATRDQSLALVYSGVK